MDRTRILTVHFLQDLLSPDFLPPRDRDAFLPIAILLGTCCFSVGVFLPRVFFRKYVDLITIGDPIVYARALTLDQVMVFSATLLLVALVTALAVSKLVPTSLDFMALMPLPLTYADLVRAKLAAALVFAVATSASAFVILGLSFPVATHDSFLSGHSLPTAIAAQAAASVLGSCAFVLTIAALLAAMLVLIPRRYAPFAPAILQASIFSGTFVVIPWLISLPRYALNGSLADTWLVWLPPAWCVAFVQALTSAAGTAGAWWALPAWFVTAGAAALVWLRLLGKRLSARTGDIGARSPQRRVAVARWSGVDAASGFLWRSITRIPAIATWLISATAVGIAIGVRPLIFPPKRSYLASGGGELWLEGGVSIAYLLALALIVVWHLPIDGHASWCFHAMPKAVVAPSLIGGMRRVLRAVLLVPFATALAAAAWWDSSRLTASGVLCAGVYLLVFAEVLLRWAPRVPHATVWIPNAFHILMATILAVVGLPVFTFVARQLVRTSRAGDAWPLVIAAILTALCVVLRVQPNRGDDKYDWREAEPGPTTLSLSS